MIDLVISAIGGSCFASALACVPGLHVYNVIALLLVGFHGAEVWGGPVQETAVSFVAGMIAGFAVTNTIPSILLAAPDESAVFTVMPGQNFLKRGAGFHAVIITSLGGLIGLLCLAAAVPIAPMALAVMHPVLRPHAHWILWSVIAFMLLSEWPRARHFGPAGWRAFRAAWTSLAAGLGTFLLSGLLGFILFYRAPFDPQDAFQCLMPAFIGLFTLPWLMLNIAGDAELPAQCTETGTISSGPLIRGGVAGALGGAFAAFFPGITGGVGGFLAGHATAIHDDRTFLVSQGTCKALYYAGGLLLFFVPGLNLTRGGAAGMLRGVYAPGGKGDYYTVAASLAIGGAVALGLLVPLTRATLTLVVRMGQRRISGVVLAVIGSLVFLTMGGMGLAISAVSAGIGLLPVFYGARRMNCLGIILLPLACNFSGIGGRVAGWLGLI